MDFKKMYSAKQKKVKDPNAPPRPNLLSHDKVIRGITADLGATQFTTQQQHQEISKLTRKLNQALYRIELLTGLVKDLRDNKRK